MSGKNSKLKLSNMWIDVSFTSVKKYGSTVITTEHMVGVGRYTKEGDDKPSLYAEYRDSDTKSIKHMGVEIKEYQQKQKFFNYHKEMGLEFNDKFSLTAEEIIEMMPKEVIDVINKYND